MGWGFLAQCIDKCSWIPGPIGTAAGYATDIIQVGVAIYSGAGALQVCKMIVTKAVVTTASTFVGGKLGKSAATKLTKKFGKAMEKPIAKASSQTIQKVGKFTSKAVGKVIDKSTEKITEKAVQNTTKTITQEIIEQGVKKIFK